MVYVFLADGFEEMEAIAPIDLLRRSGAKVEIVAVGAKVETVAVGTQVKTVGVGDRIVHGAHGIPITCDISEREISTEGLEMVVLPGGMPGTTNLDQSDAVEHCLLLAEKQGLWVGAICAAPSVLGHKGLLRGKKATCFPGFEQELAGASFTGAPVEQDGKIITARGAGVAVEFGLKLVEVLKGAGQAQALKEAIQCQK